MRIPKVDVDSSHFSCMAGSTPLERALSTALENRRKAGTLRSIADTPLRETKFDFSSNDYLGLSRHPALREHFLSSLQRTEHILGSTASRLLDGNSPEHIVLEKRLAAFYNSPAALLFNSGYDANVGIFSVLPQPGDAVLYDELIHASVHDGMRASRTAEERRISFKHNSVPGLKDALTSLLAVDRAYAEGRKSIFIAVEALYSMDGDFAPLDEIVRVVKQHLARGNGHLIVDEAHTNGMIGPKGRGMVSHFDLEADVLVRLNTFGKACGSAGAVVLCTPLIRNFLLNYARSVIYTTALPQFNVISISCVLDFLEQGVGETLAAQMTAISTYLRSSLSRCLARHPKSNLTLVPSTSVGGVASPIIPLLTNEPRPLALFLQGRGFMVRPIAPPTVPKGLERVRICVHASNTREEVDRLVEALEEWFVQQARAKL